MLLAAFQLALAFAPGHEFAARRAMRLPGQAAHAPTMLLDGATQWLADAAIFLPDAADAATAAASTAADAVAADPGWFDVCVAMGARTVAKWSTRR